MGGAPERPLVYRATFMGGRHEPQRYYRLLDHGLRAGLRRFHAEPAGGNQPRVERG